LELRDVRTGSSRGYGVTGLRGPARFVDDSAVTVLTYHLGCQVCRGPVAPAGPAVATFGDADNFLWVPFVEDLRTTSAKLIHPTCFVNLHGVEPLISVVHNHDEQMRRSSFADQTKIMRLERELRTLRESTPDS
jgi:hypothetical protein